MIEHDNNQPAVDDVADTDITEAQSIADNVRTALRQVIDPEIGLDVVALGLIREIEVSPDKLHIIMILTTPFCPYGPQIMEQSRRAGQESTGLPTTIEMGLQMWDPSMMEDGVGDDWGLF